MRPADLIWDLAEELAQAGFQSPGADARWLVSYACNEEVSTLLARWEVSSEEESAARELLKLRLAGHPVQHITGQAPFRFEVLSVGPGVFIPRPETELVAGAAIEVLSKRPVQRRTVVEFCAGSGAITRSILRELGGVRAYVNEWSTHAEPYLRDNLSGLPAHIEIGDCRNAFEDLAGKIDLVVANPPYLPRRIRSKLPAEVVNYDPEEALFSGEDGLELIRDLVPAAAQLLVADGVLVLEHDESHQDQVIEIVTENNFSAVEECQDLTGRPRFIVARR